MTATVSDGYTPNTPPPPGHHLSPCDRCGAGDNERCVKTQNTKRKGQPASNRRAGRTLTQIERHQDSTGLVAPDLLKALTVAYDDHPTIEADLEWLRTVSNELPARVGRILTAHSEAVDELAFVARRYDRLRDSLAGLAGDQT